ncbi:MAG: hypothetical protein NZM26_03840 [Patescibacteria group bacterium]|nr:hypothetical protein [Patescibacteria group bacterium]
MQPFGIKILLLGVFITVVSLAGFFAYRYSVRPSANLSIESTCFSSTARLTYDNPNQVKTVYINGEKTNEIEFIWTGDNKKEYIAYVEWNDGSTFQTTKIAEKPSDCAEVPTPTPAQSPAPEEVLGTISSPTVGILPNTFKTSTPTPTASPSPTKLAGNVLTVSPTPTLSPRATSTLSPTSSPIITATKTPSPSPTKMTTPTPTLTPTRLPTITPSPTLVATYSGQVKGDKEELPSTGVSIQSIIAIAFLGFTGLVLYKRFRLI